MTHNLIYIGEKFYLQSGTMMSSIYEQKNNHYSRTDWGFVSVALSNGDKIKIRPATERELKYFNKILETNIYPQ